MTTRHKQNEKTREKISRNNARYWLGKKGKDAPVWKGGKKASYDRWAKANPELVKFYRRQYYYRKRGAFGSHTLEEWELLKAQYNWTCPRCFREEPEIKLEADHIIPLVKGGSNNIENIQPLCRNCNAKKHTKL